LAGIAAGDESECRVMTEQARFNSRRARQGIWQGDLDNHLHIASNPDLATYQAAFANLVTAMARLSRPQRVEVARIGRKARAARMPRIRRLARAAAAEARRLAREAIQ
jgi:hypothetical protein